MSATKRRVVDVIHIAPTPFFSNRGCHIRIRNFVDALATQGLGSVVCTYALGDNPEGREVRRTWPIPGYRKRDVGFAWGKFPSDVLLFFVALWTVFQTRPRVIYGHLHEGGLIGWAVKWVLFWRPHRLVMDVQGSLTGELEAYGTLQRQSRMSRVARSIERFICRLPDYMTCSSVASRRMLIDQLHLPGGKVAVLDDFVPPPFFAASTIPGLRGRLGIEEEQPVLIYTGSLLPGKGINVLYGALEQVLSRHRTLCVLFVGSPRELAEAWARRAGVHERCRFTGEVPYGELAAYLAIADVAVDPKQGVAGEASGKLLHYMAAALPVVCFDTTNNRSLVGDFGHYSLGPDAHDLAENILGVFANLEEATRKAQGMISIVRERYSAEGSGRRLAEILGTL